MGMENIDVGNRYHLAKRFESLARYYAFVTKLSLTSSQCLLDLYRVLRHMPVNDTRYLVIT